MPFAVCKSSESTKSSVYGGLSSGLQKSPCSSMRHFVFEIGVHCHQALHCKNSLTHAWQPSSDNAIRNVRSGISSNTRSTFYGTRGAHAPPRHVLAAAILLSQFPRDEQQDEKAVPPGSTPCRKDTSTKLVTSARLPFAAGAGDPRLARGPRFS